MRTLKYTDRGFADELASLNRDSIPEPAVEKGVRDIIAKVRRGGDAALLKLTGKFDGVILTPEELRVTGAELKNAENLLAPHVRNAIQMAHENVRDFALRSKRENWSGKNHQGVKVGERFDPFERVGIYVPAGTAPLASTVIMTVTLAAAAGVPEIVVVGGGIVGASTAYRS